VAIAVCGLTACGDGGPTTTRREVDPATIREPAPRIGTGPRYRFPPRNRSVAEAAPVGALRCRSSAAARVGVHLEVLANRRDVVIPAGIGVARPIARHGAYVSGRCSYPARTLEPTGLVELIRAGRLTLGRFFDLWGWPLTRTRVLGFQSPRGARITVFVDGRRTTGDPRAIPLRRHRAIVIEARGYVRPRSRYLFPRGL
jgi:hypothetical protein